MSEYYSLIDLSENIKMSPDDGYLYCFDAPIARTGDLKYKSYESRIDSKNGETVVSRTEDDLFNENTLSSFEGKPITMGHPDSGAGFVDSENWKDFAVGEVKNVRRGKLLDADKLLADLIIKDKEAIDAVLEKRVRQLSCGYKADFFKTGNARGKQKNILGNHIALVEKGRCGSQCAISDSAPEESQMEISMTVRDKLKRSMGLINSVMDEDMPDGKENENVSDEMQGAISKMSQRFDALETRFDEFLSANKPKDESPDEDQDNIDTKQDDRLDMVMELLGKISSQILPTGDADGDLPDDKKATSDSATISRAEILSAGISDGKNIKERALKAAYGTKEGKAVIDGLLSGKAFDSADEDMLFFSASEVLKAQRIEKTNSLRMNAKDKAEEKIYLDGSDLNALNKKFYEDKKGA